jgi:hypothetical protein
MLVRVRNLHRKELLFDAQEGWARPVGCVGDARRRDAHIIEVGRPPFAPFLKHFGRDSRNETMIGVPVAAVRTPRDHGIRA